MIIRKIMGSLFVLASIVLLTSNISYGFDIKGIKLGMTVIMARDFVDLRHGPIESSYKSTDIYHTGHYKDGGTISCFADKYNVRIFQIQYTYKTKEIDRQLFDMVLAKAIAKYGEPDSVEDQLLYCKYKNRGSKIALWKITKDQYYHKCYPESSLPDHAYLVLKGDSRGFFMELTDGKILKKKWNPLLDK